MPPSLPVQSVIEQTYVKADSPRISFGSLRFDFAQDATSVVQIARADDDAKPPEPFVDKKADDKKAESLSPPPAAPSSEPNSPATTPQTTAATQQTQQRSGEPFGSDFSSCLR